MAEIGPIEQTARDLTQKFGEKVFMLPAPIASGFNKLAWLNPISWPFKSLVRTLDNLIK